MPHRPTRPPAAAARHPFARDARTVVLPPIPTYTPLPADDAPEDAPEEADPQGGEEEFDLDLSGEEYAGGDAADAPDDEDDTLASLADDVTPLAIAIPSLAEVAPVRRIGAQAVRPLTALVTRTLVAPQTTQLVIGTHDAGTSGATGTAHRSRWGRIPGRWMLVNLLILVVAGVAVLPHLAESAEADASAACNWHIVRPGETLAQLGGAHHISVATLAKANHIVNVDLIYVGQRLCIPTTDWAQAKSAPAIPASAHPPTYADGSSVDRFIQLALPYARRAHEATGWPTSVILAQWGLEHGWAIPGFTGYNWGNCGAVPDEPMVAGTSAPGSPSAFAYARTPEDGLRIYLHVAALSYYTTIAPAARQGSADDAARALGRSPWDAGHYTDSGDPGSSLLALMRHYNLYWFDAN